MTRATRQTDLAPEPAFDPARPAGAGQAGDAFQSALLESRQRWRQFGAIATDLAFETDESGRLTFIAPDHVLGWSAADLLGQPAEVLLTDSAGINPFDVAAPQHRRHTWVRTRQGGLACLALTTVPMLGAGGEPRGMRGIAVNVTEQERAGAATSLALRRGDVLNHIMSRMRQEVLAPRMMKAVLDAMTRALGGQGAAVLDLLRHDRPLGPECVLHATGDDPARLLDVVVPAFSDDEAGTLSINLPDGTQLLASSCSTRFGDRAALVIWRAPGARPWDAEDATLVGSVSGLVRIVMEHGSIQRELARQARTDPLTGLLNRRAFLEEASRRLDRLERDGMPGTLLFVDLDRLKQLNDRKGHEAGDAAIVLASGLLHRTFRPSDLVARLGGDEFAVWLDGADSLTAAERAEDLRLSTPGELAHLTEGDDQPMGMSIGIATREPGSDETLEQIIQRADQAMYDVKRQGRGHWRVSQLTGAR